MSLSFSNDRPSNTRKVQLSGEEELKVQVDFGCDVKIQITAGNAEINGTELAANIPYTFTGMNFGVWSWEGCEIEITGTTISEVICKESADAMNSYLNVHVALEQMREDADDKRGMGPKVMIVGSPSSGKSTLSKILLSYALKCGRTPLFVDLDIGMGSVAIPGTVSAMCVTQIIDPSMGHLLSNGLTTASSGDIPLTYYYGFNTHQENFQYYKFLVNKLARDVEKRCESDLAARCSGMVIDTVGLIKPEGLAYDAVIQAIESFKVNAILVLSNPELYTALVEKFPSTLSTSPQILRLVSLPNLTPFNEDQVKTLTSTKIREYFYGIPGKLELSPHRINVPWALIKVVRVGEEIAQEQPDTESTSPSSQSLHLPQTTASISENISVIQVSDGNILIGSILSVVSESEELFVRTRTKSLQGSSAKEGKETGGEDGDDGMETVVWKCSEGFVYVSDYNEVTNKLSLLIPFPGSRFTKKICVMGGLKWKEV